jgi:hypothetical protein
MRRRALRIKACGAERERQDCSLAHAVLVGFSQFAQLAVEVNRHLKVEVTVVARVGTHCEIACDHLTLLHCDIVLEVEHGLLPVGVGGLGRCAEANAHVALGELDVEKGHQSLHVVVAAHLQMERRRERQILFFHCVQIHLFHH